MIRLGNLSFSVRVCLRSSSALSQCFVFARVLTISDHFVLATNQSLNNCSTFQTATIEIRTFIHWHFEIPMSQEFQCHERERGQRKRERAHRDRDKLAPTQSFQAKALLQVERVARALSQSRSQPRDSRAIEQAAQWRHGGSICSRALGDSAFLQALARTTPARALARHYHSLSSAD